MGDEQTLCQKACELFVAGDYSAAESALSALAEIRKSDWRTSLNKAVVNFCASRLTKLDDFLSELNKICEQLQIRLEVGNLASAKQPQDGTTLCLYYNYALSLFLGCQFSMASCVIDRLLPFCEPYDDHLSIRIAFLAIHLNLIRGSHDRAMNLISQIEGVPIQQIEASEGQMSDSDTTGHSASWGKNRIALYKAYAFLLAGNMKSSKRELKQLSSNLSGKPLQSHAAYTSYMLAWLKCHFEYLRGNGRKTLKLLNGVSSLVDHADLPFAENLALPGFDHAAAYAIVRGCGMFQLRRFNSAAVHLLDAWEFLDKYCQQAGTSNGALSLRNLSFAAPAYSAVGYNIACCFLHAGLYRAAFDAFISTLGGVKHMPQVWLHIAECCIQIHEQSKQNSRSGSCRLSVAGSSFGNGLHRKIPINSDFLRQSIPSVDSQQHQQRPSLEFASACLSNCLMLVSQYRALAGSAAKVSVSEELITNRPTASIGLPSSVVSTDVLDSVQAHALLSLCYVSLCLNNFSLAIRTGTDLLALGSKLSAVVKYLGHLYMAEALINVDRIADAVAFLSAGNLAPDFASSAVGGRASVSSISGTPRERSLDVDNANQSSTADPSLLTHGMPSAFWPNSQSAGQAVLVYNLAVAYATRGDLDRARANLETAMSSIPEPWPAHFYHLSFYLALCDAPSVGSSRALDLVRKYYPHVTPNR